MLRALLLIHEAARHGILYLLEHPEDGGTPHPSFWITDQAASLIRLVGGRLVDFDQCTKGQVARKATTLATNLVGLWTLHGNRCNHPQGHPRNRNTDHLARWPEGLRSAIAQYLSDGLALDPRVAQGDNDTQDTQWWQQPRKTGGPHPHGGRGPLTTQTPRECEVRPRATMVDRDEVRHPGRDTEHIRIGHKTRPIRDGGGLQSHGRWRPSRRPGGNLGHLGQALISLTMTNDLVAATLHSVGTEEEHHPYTEAILQQARYIIGEYTGCPQADRDYVPEGQPFYTRLLHHAAYTAGDTDHQFPLLTEPGLPLGVDEELDPAWGIWPLKDAYAEGDLLNTEDDPHPEPNYPSEELHRETLRKTYIEDALEGMVIGPVSPAEAARICNCTEEQLIHGALAAKDEGAKVRTIHDGTVVGVNPAIQAHTPQKTLVPHIPDLMHALAVMEHEHELDGAPRPSDPPIWPASAARSGGAPGVRRTATAAPLTPPLPDMQTTTLLKLDVTKAHRRIKILPKDWRYITARLGDEVFINTVGTFGVASAQFYWGRMAALLLRLLYHLTPQGGWHMVYVDDFISAIDKADAPLVMTLICLILTTFGTPLSWKKTSLGDLNIWLGFLIHCGMGTVQAAMHRIPTLRMILHDIDNGTAAGEKRH
jgi:hypothetical protein